MTLVCCLSSDKRNMCPVLIDTPPHLENAAYLFDLRPLRFIMRSRICLVHLICNRVQIWDWSSSIYLLKLLKLISECLQSRCSTWKFINWKVLDAESLPHASIKGLVRLGNFILLSLLVAWSRQKCSYFCLFLLSIECFWILDWCLNDHEVSNTGYSLLQSGLM